MKQIATGTYSYVDKHNKMHQSHALYGINDKGEVVKYMQRDKKWVLLEEVFSDEQRTKKKFLDSVIKD